MSKREFLVASDYGMGGSWAFLLAESEEEVRARFPELTIVTKRPQWMDDAEEQNLRARMTVDIDDESHPFLAMLIEERTET